MRRVIRTSLVLIAILAVLVPWSVWMLRPITSEPSSAVRAMEEDLARNPPELLFLGSSLVDRAIDPARFARLLGLPPAKVQVLFLPGTGAVASYVLLKNRVYANGHRPRLVVVANQLSELLGSDWPEGDLGMRLQRQMGPAEPVVARKAGQEHYLLARLRQRRVSVRQGLLDGLRNRTVASVLLRTGETPDPTDSGENGAASPDELTEAALARVFADDALLPRPRKRVIPVIEPRGDAEVQVELSLQGSFLPDLVDLAQEHGSKIVFLRLPVSPIGPPGSIPKELEQELIDYMNSRGAGYLDLSDLSLGQRHFADYMHLNRAGQEVLLPALAQGLRRLRALSDGPMATATVPLRPDRIRRRGTPDPVPQPTELRARSGCRSLLPLAELAEISDSTLTDAGYGAISPLSLWVGDRELRAHDKDSCDGAFRHQSNGVDFSWPGQPQTIADLRVEWATDLPGLTSTGRPTWWVFPGTSLELDFAQPWSSQRGTFAVHLAVSRFGEGEGRLHVGEQQWAVAGPPRQRLQVKATPPREAWTLELQSPPGGPAILVEALLLGEQSLVLGSAAALQAPELALFGPGGGNIVPQFRGSPPAITAPVPRQAEGPEDVSATEPDLVVFDVGPRLGSLGHDGLQQRVPHARHCSPLRVSYEGSVLPIHWSPRRAAKQKRRGRVAHLDRRLLASTPDGSPADPQLFSFSLAPERRCKRLLWLYPRDHARFDVPWAQLSEGVAALRLQGLHWSEQAEQLRIEVVLSESGKDGQVREHRRDITFAQLGRTGGSELELPSMPAMPGQSLHFELINPSDDFVLVQRLDLVGR